MKLGRLQSVLGRDYLQAHDPIIRASNNYYPIFDRPACKHHTQVNATIKCPPIFETPRAFEEVNSICHISTNSVSHNVSLREQHQANMLSSLLTSDLQDNVSNVIDGSNLNLDKSDTVQPWTNQSSRWTVPNSVNDITTLPLESMEIAQDSILGDNTHQEKTTLNVSGIQSQIKRKKNKYKNREVSLNDYLSLASPSEFVGVIHADNAAVHIDKDICPFVEQQDSCFIAFVFPSTSAVTTATPSPGGTVDPVVLPEEYSDLKAAFSDGTHELPEHGPHDIEITLESNKVPPLGPLYSLSDSEQKIVEKYVKDMVDKGLIRPSKSPCGAPILFAQKKRRFAPTVR